MNKITFSYYIVQLKKFLDKYCKFVQIMAYILCQKIYISGKKADYSVLNEAEFKRD